MRQPAVFIRRPLFYFRYPSDSSLSPAVRICHFISGNRQASSPSRPDTVYCQIIPLPTVVPQSSGDSRLTTGRYSACGRRQSYTFSPGVAFSPRRHRHLPLRSHSHAGSRRGRGPGGLCSTAACILRSEVAPGDRYSVTAVRHSPEVPARAPGTGTPPPESPATRSAGGAERRRRLRQSRRLTKHSH